MPLRLLSAVLAAVALLAFSGRPAAASPAESVCGASSPADQLVAAGGPAPVRVAPEVGTTPTIVIGRDNRSGDVEIKFRGEADLPAGNLRFEPGRFSRGSQRLDPKTITVTVDRRNAREVVVNVCVDRNVSTVRPGAYTGSIVVRDPRLTGADVPINLNLQDSRLNWLGGLGWFLAVALAVLGVWVTLRRAAGQPIFGRRARAALKAWSNVNLLFIVAVAAAAAWVALQTQGLSDDEFGGDLNSYVRLFLAMFGAAYTVGNLPPAVAGKEPPTPDNAA
jgi:hypothetical protein